jgi:hypothetical protein
MSFTPAELNTFLQGEANQRKNDAVEASLRELKKWCEKNNQLARYNELLKEFSYLADYKSENSNTLLSDLIANFLSDATRLANIIAVEPFHLYDEPAINLWKLTDTAKKTSALVNAVRNDGDVDAAINALNNSADKMKYDMAGSISPFAGVMLGLGLLVLAMTLAIVPFVVVPLLGGLVGILHSFGTLALIGAEFGLLMGFGPSPMLALGGVILAISSSVIPYHEVDKTKNSAKKFAENSALLFAKKSERVEQEIEMVEYNRNAFVA